mmetsp:Transcript_29232/g.87411  ORF Transcript_29232/g.87411 Transcript_29232/m.87411 type:complete len:230 (+) Transcript_29232:229-918(+)
MADAPVPEDEDAAQELARLSDREVPAALNELGQKHQFVNDVIQWCESSYSSGDKNAVMDQTKEYLVDALETVARDVEETSAKLVRALALQADAVDHLALDLDVVKERLAVAKEQNAQARLDAFRPPAPARAPRKPTSAQASEKARTYGGVRAGTVVGAPPPLGMERHSAFSSAVRSTMFTVFYEAQRRVAWCAWAAPALCARVYRAAPICSSELFWVQAPWRPHEAQST